ncbi:MAG: hypothetical protein WD749_04370 [Phycisphaerales bacterium]
MNWTRFRSTFRNMALVAAAGCAASAHAQPTVVNLSGATLLENFLNKPAATNDYLDCDADGISGQAGTGIDNLSPTPGTGFTVNDHWVMTYRVAGSVAGYQELVNYGQVAGNCASPTAWPGLFVTGSAGLVSPPSVVFGNQTTGPIQLSGASKQYYNGVLLYDTTVVPNNFHPTLYTEQNPAGLPVGASLTTLRAVIGAPAAGGYRVDMAPVDVPSTWAVRAAPGTAGPAATPGEAGYGRNPRLSVNTQGTGAGAGFDYLLADLGIRNLNFAAPDCNTIFDTSLFFAPIALVASHGTGVEQMDQSEVRFFFATGRRLNGENLIAITREIGSGTRNGFNNTTGCDPSWGVGDNVGGQPGGLGTTGTTNILGDQYAPANKIGNGDVETTVRNTRLGVGYAGAERFSNARAAQYELVAVRCDLAGGTAYTRPTLNALLNNIPGTHPGLYSIGGPSIFASIGDPRNQAMIGGEPGNTNPRMANAQGAAFINNVSRSIDAFVAVPANVNNQGMPGELAATLFIPSTARPYRNSFTDPAVLEPNPAYNASLAAALPQYSVLDDPPINAAYGSVSLNGQTPFRRNGAGITYTDGVLNGSQYLKQDGTTIGYNVPLPARSRIAGDFNGDGLRNLSDATDMLRAYRQRNGGPTWTAPAGTGTIAGNPGGDAIIEVLGDFNGDGNFNAADIRYWADGLAIDPATGKLDRKKGFKAVDDAWQALTGSGNFFGTTIAGGRPYASGDSAADVAGAPGIARGWSPVGTDGVIDQQDRDYIAAQFIGNPFITDGQATWAALAEAVGFDLSADVTGDLVVNQADLDAVDAILGACYANCDSSTTPPVLNVADFGCFLTRYAAAEPYANCDASTTPPILNVADFGCFLTKYAAGCP